MPISCKITVFTQYVCGKCYKNNKKEWNEALDAYDMTEKEMLEFKGNPLDNAEKLAEYAKMYADNFSTATKVTLEFEN